MNIIKEILSSPAVKGAVYKATGRAEMEILEAINNTGSPHRKRAYESVYSEVVEEKGLPVGYVRVNNPLFFNIVEKGVKPFDMKKGLLASPKAKRSKKGIRYITVPIRYGVPTAKGTNLLSDEEYKRAKALSQGQQIGTKRKGKNIVITKIDTSAGKNTSSSYFSFVNVAENSKGWIHKGFRAYPFLKDAIKRIRKQNG